MQLLKVKENTVLDFYNDFYKKEDTCWIDDYGKDEKGYYLIFSNTIFYPHGGGQKGDRGKVLIPDNFFNNKTTALNIIDTRKYHEKDISLIKHYIDTDLNDEYIEKLLGNKFTIKLDWNFRFTQMRLHAIAHILHFFIEKYASKKIPYPKISDLSPTNGLNSYEGKNLISEEKFNLAVSDFNEWIKKDHSIKTYSDPKKENNFRIWECSNWKVPCGGTHLQNTQEIGEIKATLTLKKKSTNILFSLIT